VRGFEPSDKVNRSSGAIEGEKAMRAMPEWLEGLSAGTGTLNPSPGADAPTSPLRGEVTANQIMCGSPTRKAEIAAWWLWQPRIGS